MSCYLFPVVVGINDTGTVTSDVDNDVTNWSSEDIQCVGNEPEMRTRFEKTSSESIEEDEADNVDQA